MTVKDRTEQLAHLAQRFAAEGFVVRDAPFFSESGIAVATRPQATTATDEIIQAVEAMVFVYATADGWQLRATQHGGPHWVRDPASERDLEDLVRAYLSNPARPPGPGWREV